MYGLPNGHLSVFAVYDVSLLPLGWYVSPLQGYAPPKFHQGSLIFCQYPYILLGGERHWGGNVFYPRTQQNDQVSNLDSPPRVQRTNLFVIGFPTILSVAYMYFTTTTTSTPSSVLEPLSDIWYRCRSGVPRSSLCFSKLHHSSNTLSNNVHKKIALFRMVEDE